MSFQLILLLVQGCQLLQSALTMNYLAVEMPNFSAVFLSKWEEIQTDERKKSQQLNFSWKSANFMGNLYFFLILDCKKRRKKKCCNLICVWKVGFRVWDHEITCEMLSLVCEHVNRRNCMCHMFNVSELAALLVRGVPLQPLTKFYHEKKSKQFQNSIKYC